MAVTINGVVTNKLILKQKEGKRIKITYNVTLGTATFSLVCKDSSGVVKFLKEDSSFDKTEVADKIIYIILTVEDLDVEVGQYDMELKTTWNATNSVDKTETIKFKIIPSIH